MSLDIPGFSSVKSSVLNKRFQVSIYHRGLFHDGKWMYDEWHACIDNVIFVLKRGIGHRVKKPCYEEHNLHTKIETNSGEHIFHLLETYSRETIIPSCSKPELDDFLAVSIYEARNVFNSTFKEWAEDMGAETTCDLLASYLSSQETITKLRKIGIFNIDEAYDLYQKAEIL